MPAHKPEDDVGTLIRAKQFTWNVHAAIAVIPQPNIPEYAKPAVLSDPPIIDE